MSSNVTLHGKDYQTGNILPIAVNSTGELIIDSGGAIDLANLGDVSIAGLANNNLLQYDGTVNYWVNRDSLGGNVGFESLHATGPATLTDLWVSGDSNLSNLTATNLSITGLSNLTEVGISGNLDVLGLSNLGNVEIGNLVVYGTSSFFEGVGMGANLDVIGYVSSGDLLSSGISNLTEVGVSGNLDVLGITTLANISGTNLSITGLSNLSEVGISGNLDVLGLSTLANISGSNLSITGLSNLTEVGISANLDVLGITTVANLAAGNLHVLHTANIGGDTTFNSNLLITGQHYVFFTDANTYIHGQTVGGNLDITNLAGNVNITANTDIILTTNTGSTIKLVGPTEQMLAVSQPSTGNIYMNFGTDVGDSGYGIWSDNGVLKRKNDGDAGWVELSSGTGGASNLANLGDVQFALPLANNEILAYDSTLSKWTNFTLGDVVAQIGYYGVFYDTTTQNNTPANTSRAMKCNSTAEAKGVSVDTNGVFTVDNAGVYNIQFSTQLTKTDSGNDIVDIWFRKNGSNLAESNTEYTIVGNNGRSVAALNYVLTLAANSNIEIMWRAADPQISLLHQDATSNVPAIPSVIVTITPVQYIQNGTLNLGDLLNVSTVGQANNHVLQYNSALNRWDTRANLTIEPGSLAIFGSGANIGSNAATGNLVINAGNLDISGATILTHIHNNLLVSGNLVVSHLSNLANVGISGNLDVLGHTGLANLSAGNLVVSHLSNLANVGISGNLDVLGTSNLGNVEVGNLIVYGTSSFFEGVGMGANLDVIGYISGADLLSSGISNLTEVGVSANLDVLGYSNLANVAVGNIQVLDAGRIEFRDGNTFIQSIETGNLDIKSLDGNINITANHDIILTANSPSTIRLVGPGNAPIVAFNLDAGGNAFMSFGSATGDAGYGIKADPSGNVLLKSLGSPEWGSVGNTQISIAGRSVALGGSNTIGFEDLTGSIDSTTQISMGSIGNDLLTNSSLTIGTTTISLGGSSSIGFSDITGSIDATNQISMGSIGNDRLTSDSITVAGQTVSLGGSASIGFSDLTGNIDATQISPSSITNDQLAGSITNDKLANSNIIIGGQTILLGGSGSLAFSNITGNIAATQISPSSITNDQLAGSITNSKLANSNIIIGGQTINLGGSGSLAFSNITGSVAVGQLTDSSITNTKLANSTVNIGGRIVALGSSNTISFSDLSGTVDRIIFTDDKIKLGSSSGGTATTGIHSIAIGTSAGAQNQGNACVAIGSSAQALLGNYNDHRIAIGFTTGTSNQATKAVAIGSYSGANNQGANSVAIGYYAGNSSQPSSSIILSATGADWSSSATTQNAFYVKPIRNNTTTNVNPSLYYNTTSGEISYNTRDYYALTMYGTLNGTYVNGTSSATKDLFQLISTYWSTTPNSSATSIIISPSTDTRYNTTTGVITLTNSKRYMLDVSIQMCVGVSTSTFQLELIKNPTSPSNTIAATVQVGVADSPDYAQFTLPLKYIINSWSDMKICAYKPIGSGSGVGVLPGCEIALSLIEI